MKLATTVTWLLATGMGFYLLIVWLADGGLRRQATKVTRFPALLTLVHPLLALGGLGFWTAYLLTSRRVYVWTSLAILVVTALLGFTMLTRWLLGRGRHARGAGRRFPVLAVFLHGLVGVATFVLVLLTAATGAGGA
ncbi:hypothetical protein [Rhizohabitans arisaemae]|uniref:hypothetical protein n=1 Tax=Rhizohabitans arisaemae TaxID=2720610 RepID=UPI0024B22A66|nr:hypothetical protein [Rhizohabitans arisaemae]